MPLDSPAAVVKLTAEHARLLAVKEVIIAVISVQSELHLLCHVSNYLPAHSLLTKLPTYRTQRVSKGTLRVMGVSQW